MDSTGYLQGLIDLASPGAVIDLAPARYDLAGTIVLRKPVTLRGANVVLRQLPSLTRDRSAIKVLSGGVRIEGLEIDGGNVGGGAKTVSSALEAQHGIAVLGCTDVTLKGLHIHHTTADGIYISRAPDANVRPWSKNVTVTGTHLHHLGRHGVTVTGGDGITITRSLIRDAGRAILDMEPSGVGTGARNVTVSDNWIGKSNLLFVAAEGRGDVSHVSILRNVIIGDTMEMSIRDLDGGRRTDWRVEGCTSDTAAGNPSRGVIRAVRIDGLVVKDCRQPVSKRDPVAGNDASMAMVAVTDCTNVVASGNVLGPAATRTNLGQIVVTPST